MTQVGGRPGAQVRTAGGEFMPRIVAITGDLDNVDLVLAGDCGIRSGAKAIELVAEVLLTKSQQGAIVNTSMLGPVELREVHGSWSRTSALREVGLGPRKCLQIVPLAASHMTIDAPRMQTEFGAVLEPAWAYLAGPDAWPFPFPAGLTVVTDSNALRGAPVTEAARWDDGEFQMLAIGEDNLQPPTEDLRVVPFSTLAAADSGLEPLFETPPGCSWWRADVASPWQRWRGWQ